MTGFMTGIAPFKKFMTGSLWNLRRSSDRIRQRRAREDVPCAPVLEIRDWIHDWNRATQEFHDWLFLKSKEEHTPV